MTEMKLVSFDEVSKHSTRSDVWFIIDGLVYDVTQFLDEKEKHPGGEEVLLELAGVDATEGFDQIGHSDDARDMLKKFLVGKLDPKDVSAASAPPLKKGPEVNTESKPQGTSILGWLLGK